MSYHRDNARELAICRVYARAAKRRFVSPTRQQVGDMILSAAKHQQDHAETLPFGASRRTAFEHAFMLNRVADRLKFATGGTMIAYVQSLL